MSLINKKPLQSKGFGKIGGTMSKPKTNASSIVLVRRTPEDLAKSRRSVYPYLIP